MSWLSYKKLVMCNVGLLGGGIAGMFGGWDAGIKTLIVFMALDYVTGILVACIFHASKKTENGACSSHASIEGLVRKCTMLLFVIVGSLLDQYTGNSFIRDSIIAGFVANELISLVENAGLMGIPLPRAITNAIEVLKQKAENNNEEKVVKKDE